MTNECAHVDWHFDSLPFNQARITRKMSNSPQLNMSSSHKIIFVGSEDVGKKALVSKFIKGFYVKDMEQDIESSTFSKVITLDEFSHKLDCEIVPSSQQQQGFSLLTLKEKASHADGIVVIYSITDEQSFQFAKSLVFDFLQHKKEANSKHEILVLGNKNDLCDHARVATEEVESFCQQQSLHFAETSAWQQDNIEAVMQPFLKAIVQKHLMKTFKLEALVDHSGEETPEKKLKPRSRSNSMPAQSILKRASLRIANLLKGSKDDDHPASSNQSSAVITPSKKNDNQQPVTPLPQPAKQHDTPTKPTVAEKINSLLTNLGIVKKKAK